MYFLISETSITNDRLPSMLDESDFTVTGDLKHWSFTINFPVVNGFIL